MKKQTLEKVLSVLIFVFGIALGITILTFGFKVLYEAAKIIF